MSSEYIVCRKGLNIVSGNDDILLLRILKTRNRDIFRKGDPLMLHSLLSSICKQNFNLQH